MLAPSQWDEQTQGHKAGVANLGRKEGSVGGVPGRCKLSRSRRERRHPNGQRASREDPRRFGQSAEEGLESLITLQL